MSQHISTWSVLRAAKQVSALVTPSEGPLDPRTAPGVSTPGTDPRTSNSGNTPGTANPGHAQASQVGISNQSCPVPWRAALGEFDDNLPRGAAAGHPSAMF
jgi:hypothetical protein